MDFDKKRFADLFKKAQGDRSMNKFATDAEVAISYVSRILRGVLEVPPSSTVIKKIAEVAQGDVTYLELMQAAGHLNEAEMSDLSEQEVNLLQYWKDRALEAEKELDDLKSKIKVFVSLIA